MDDRTLLERAARAAGINRRYYEFAGESGMIDDDPDGGMWNPLVDDGDAFRLAVKLRLDLRHFESFVDCERRGGDIWPAYDSQHGGDRNAATRRAITRAAAALAKEPS